MVEKLESESTSAKSDLLAAKIFLSTDYLHLHLHTENLLCCFFISPLPYFVDKLRTYATTVTMDARSRDLLYVLDPSMSPDNQEIKDAVEQHRLELNPIISTRQSRTYCKLRPKRLL